MSSLTMQFSPEALSFMVNHIILPPKLPQEDDSDSTCELALVQFVRNQALAFQVNVPANYQMCWRRIVKMLDTWIKVNDFGSISKDVLVRAIYTLGSEGLLPTPSLSDLISNAQLTPFREHRSAHKMSECWTCA